MSLADHLDAAQEADVIRRPRAAPTGWEPGVRYDPTSGAPTEVTTEQVTQDVQGDPGQWPALIAHLLPMVPTGHTVRLVEARYDPVAWTRTEAFTGESKTPATTKPAWRYRFRIVPDDTTAPVGDVVELVAIARSNRPARSRRKTIAGARVVVASDPQIGKVASGGGTPELLARVETMLGHLDQVMRDEPCEESITADPGDIVEGFENVTAQVHTNDLSHPDQLRVARAVLTEIVTTVAARHRANRVLTVPSNHTQWRAGKDLRGRPGDDYGLDVHRAVAEALSRDRAFRDVAFVIPDPWRESLAVQARGAVLGLVHGHQAKPGKAWDWWKGQIGGDGPTAAANILLGGHYHSWLIEPHGALDGYPRWFMQADPLDGGSDWWTNLTGDVSEPSLMTFIIGDDGRWHSMRRITARGA